MLECIFSGPPLSQNPFVTQREAQDTWRDQVMVATSHLVFASTGLPFRERKRGGRRKAKLQTEHMNKVSSLFKTRRDGIILKLTIVSS